MNINLSTFLEEKGYDIEIYPFKKSAKFAKKWKTIFAPHYIGRCVWANFEGNDLYPQKKQAIKKFLQLPKQNFYILPSFEYKPILYKCCNNYLQDFSDYNDDLYLFDLHFLWSIIYSHEEGYGPYFVQKEGSTNFSLEVEHKRKPRRMR